MDRKPEIASPRPACGCSAASLDAHLGRRRFLQVAAGGVAAAVLAPWPALADSDKHEAGHYEAMVLACIDPRFQTLVSAYTERRHLTGKYSQFTIAGAGVGVVAPKFADWHQTFWDNLGATIQLHHINKVIVINHRDCGAAVIAYGEEALATPEKETETHRKALAEFREQLAERHPKLGVETGLMGLDGKLESLPQRGEPTIVGGCTLEQIQAACGDDY